MLKIGDYSVHGFEPITFRGMRNPMNSWDKMDSDFVNTESVTHCPHFKIGKNDHKLMMTLAKSGSDHAKYRRFLDVTVEITAPFYWWKECKTYRAGIKNTDDDTLLIPDDYLDFDIEKNSCSTMHKITDKEFTLDDFSHEHLLDYDKTTEHSTCLTSEEIESVYEEGTYAVSFHSDSDEVWFPMDLLNETIYALNRYRKAYLETKDKIYWWQIIQLLPSSYNQMRTIKITYEALYNIYHARKNHKLDEWHTFCDWIEGLPYSEVITLKED